jgi:divalent metal cation (Fe/Co/Zn/Cd) transporter
MHVQVDRSITVSEGHAIAETAERVVAEHFEPIVDVIAHLEPMDDYQADKTAAQQGSGLV